MLSSVSFFMSMVFFLLMVTIAVYSVETFHASTGEAGIASGIFIIGVLIGRLYIGRKYSDYNTKLILVISGIAVVASIFLYFIEWNLSFLFLTRLIHGITFGVVANTLATIIAVVLPPSRKGEGIGYFTMSMTLATAIGPFIGVLMSKNGNHFAIFFLCLILGMISLVFIVLSNVPSLRVKKMPGNQKLNYTQFVEPKAIPISIVVMGISFCYGSVLSFINLYASVVNLVEAASFFFLVYALAILFSRPITGKIVDAKGANYVMYPCIVLLAVGMFVLSIANTSFLLLLAAGLIGIGYGNIQSTALAVAVKTAPPKQIGLATSTYYIGMDAAIGFSPAILGLIIPFLGFQNMYLTLTFFVIFMAFFYYFVYGRNESRILVPINKSVTAR
ncbi:MFS transporter [Bacillus sp. B15-48]|nr:MFS transporter [Bacillus sp. B15-48]MBM4763012.1 MFS transporter [Bacillus sp. B15-48]